MRWKIATILSVLIASTAMPSLWAQGHWWDHPNPKVGSGGVYRITTKDGHQSEMTWAIVGKDTLGGQEGYWFEERMTIPGHGTNITKLLMVFTNGKPDIKEMIMQPPGRPPMEMPLMMMGMMKKSMQSAIANSSSTTVGIETITVPGGTFLCDHLRSSANGVTSDEWVSKSGPAFGLIKTASAQGTIELEKVLTGQTSEITGTPKQMNMPMYGH